MLILANVRYKCTNYETMFFAKLLDVILIRINQIINNLTTRWLLSAAESVRDFESSQGGWLTVASCEA